ncbi:MAG: PD-(D/E)XK nuclease superfamily protein [Bacillota bacterium]
MLISLKWQQTSGTAEQKVPFEVICLAHAVQQGGYNKAYLVLGGAGWSLRDFYANKGLDSFLRLPAEVRILKLEDYIALANQGQL